MSGNLFLFFFGWAYAMMPPSPPPTEPGSHTKQGLGATSDPNRGDVNYPGLRAA